MKLSFLVLLFSFIFSISNAQDSTLQTVGNFSLSRDGKIAWRKCFHTDLLEKGFLNEIETKNILLNLSTDSFSITGDLKPIDPDFTGFRPLQRPIRLAQGQIVARVAIKLEEAEYCITISDIFYKQLFDYRQRRKGDMTNLERGLIRRGHFIREFELPTGVILNNTFEKVFSGL